MRFTAIFTALLLSTVGSAFAAPDENPIAKAPEKSASGTKPAAGSSLDDELFKDLDIGAPAAKKPASTKPTPPPVAKPAAAGEKPDSPPTEPADGAKPADNAKPAAKLNPLDEELLKQLEGDDKPAKKPPQRPQVGGQSGARQAGEPDSDNPFIKLSRQVRDAEQRLRGSDSGDQTQELQRKIVDDLEKLIAQIEQQQAQQSKSQSQKPGAPKPGDRSKQPKPGQQQKPGNQQPSDEKSADSNENLAQRKNEKPGGGKLQDLLQKVWGELPERQRQDVMQSSFDDFPVKYQYVIEEYFKTLLKRQE